MIRKAVKADLNELANIENRAFLGNRLSRRSLSFMIINARALMLVIERDSGLVGYGLLLYRINSDIARLYSFAINPDFQGQGYARQLIGALEHDCLKPEIKLEVRRDNLTAIAFYKHIGFALINQRENYYEDGEVALIMKKRLL